MASLYYDLAPKCPVENTRWRIRCRERALIDKKFQDALWQACMDDVLFFCMFALWVLEPRAKVKQKAFCIAIGTLVVTDHGPVAIENVKLSDRVWDGQSWVSHGGALSMGIKDVILRYGVRLTKDHKVKTTHGWKASCEGYDREEVRLPDGYEERWQVSASNRDSCEVGMQVQMWEHSSRLRQSFEEGENEKLWMFEKSNCPRLRKEGCSESNTLYVGVDGSAVYQSEHSILGYIWRSWNSGLQTMEELVRSILGRHGGQAGRTNTRSHQFEWKLRTKKLSMGDMEGAGEQQETKGSTEVPDSTRGFYSSRNFDNIWRGRSNYLSSTANRTNGGKPTSTRHDGKSVPVYDIINAGDRHAFTVLGSDGNALLVHNCLWPHQEPVIKAIDDGITEAMRTEQPTSVTVPKSRAQGGTYVYLAVTIQRALKETGFTVGLVTRNENLVDSRIDDSAVMFKVAWMLDKLPEWMLPNGYDRNFGEHVIRLPNGSGWSGYSATGDVARGGRTSAFIFDEPGSEEFVAANRDYKMLSSVSHVSNFIALVSTYGVDSGVFYESASDPDNPRVFKLSWQDNPEHSKNIYVVQDGIAKAIRPEEQESVDHYIATHQKEIRSIDRRGHKIEGKIQSPWYNAHRLLPGATPRYIARELDMDARGAVGKVFSTDLIDRMKREHCRPPIWRGQPVFDSETLKLTGLIPRDDGPLKLWFRPGIDNSPPLGPFTAGCDISSGGVGAYSSNSVLSAIDNRTGEQVAEYTIKGLEPRPFARRVVGLCMWLRNALLGWEDSGVSGGFAKEVMEVVYYGNVFFRDVNQLGSQKKSRKPGWPCRDADKADMFEQMALAMENGSYIPRSEEMLIECSEYEWDGTKIIHAPTKNKGATEKNHGDRAISGAGTFMVFSKDNVIQKVDTDEEIGKNPEYGSYLWRERQEKKIARTDSPKFGIRDLIN